MKPAPLPEIEALLTAPSFPDHQHEVYRRLRAERPVYWSASLGQWLVTTFELVDELLTDPDRFSSVGAEARHVALLTDDVHAVAGTLVRHFHTPQLNITDPPDHRRIRKAVAAPFLPRRVRRFEAMVETTADRILAETSARDSVDLMDDFAARLPVEVIATFMGIPTSSLADIPRVTLQQRFFFGTNPPTREQAVRYDEAIAVWHGHLEALIRARRADPRDDVMTTIADAVTQGTLGLDEAVATALHLVIAGNSTTTGLIGNTLLALMTHPDQQALVRQDPALAEAAVEESLRHEAPLPRDRRTATRDTSLGGAEIEAGDAVVGVLAAANRDPAVFDHPDEYDLTRRFSARQHAAFGRGIHFCLGAPLARLEATVAVRSVIRHFGTIRPPAGFEPTWHPVTTHRSPNILPVG